MNWPEAFMSVGIFWGICYLVVGLARSGGQVEIKFKDPDHDSSSDRPS